MLAFFATSKKNTVRERPKRLLCLIHRCPYPLTCCRSPGDQTRLSCPCSGYRPSPLVFRLVATTTKNSHLPAMLPFQQRGEPLVRRTQHRRNAAHSIRPQLKDSHTNVCIKNQKLLKKMKVRDGLINLKLFVQERAFLKTKEMRLSETCLPLLFEEQKLLTVHLAATSPQEKTTACCSRK